MPVPVGKKATWSAAGRTSETISILEGMKAEFGNVSYAKGCEIDGDDRSGFAEAVDAECSQSKTIVNKPRGIIAPAE